MNFLIRDQGAMPFAITIQAGGLNSFLAFGMGWGGNPSRAHRPVAEAHAPVAGRVIDMAPPTVGGVPPVPPTPRAVIGYLAPARPGDPPRLLFDDRPAGRLIDVSA